MSSLKAATVSPVSLRPNAVLGSYPECLSKSPAWAERLVHSVSGALPLREGAQLKRARRFVAEVERQARAIDGHDKQAIALEAHDLRRRMVREGLSEKVLARSFALVQAAAKLTLGMRHYDVQLIGGWVMMHGMLAEMQTGEGKTLTATLPACTAALAGIPVHVITVNDYLASRDATNMQPLYTALGISVGTIGEGMDHTVRRAAYACDVTYCTAKQLAFDYLRDRLTLSGERNPLRLRLERLQNNSPRSDRLLLRGLCFGIVDEADSVLIDEARTPLLIAGPGNSRHQERDYHEAVRLARALNSGEHYRIDESGASVVLSESGQRRLAELCEPLGGIWCGPRGREQMARQALAALHLFVRDRHYIVRDNKIQIVDQHTGRTMADRSWERGLHQMIEAKEQCTLSAPPETLARISFQRFFRRYLRLSGMTGTAREVARELRSVYGLKVVTVPTHAPVRRTDLGQKAFMTAGQKWQAVLASIRTIREQGRPVLVGTRSVAESELLSRLLTRSATPHQVLNAKQDRCEAAIVARAGLAGHVTVATNMAGRGTDIPLGCGVAERGGLHVIVTGRNEARRIDRQLIGRCARHGDPGSFEMCVSLEDTLIADFGTVAVGRLAGWLARTGLPVSRWPGALAQTIAQRVAERRHRRLRRAMQHLDERLEDTLAFSGQSE